ncbi:hypothetical protein ACFQ9Y_20425 [Peribacillus simplex]|uniref:hypothetical protein n=1 Tax=Peribacillus simplex TaxID=1478 RepID=UPI003672D17F
MFKGTIQYMQHKKNNPINKGEVLHTLPEKRIERVAKNGMKENEVNMAKVIYRNALKISIKISL